MNAFIVSIANEQERKRNVVKYFVGYLKFISSLCLTFHSGLESCYDQFNL